MEMRMTAVLCLTITLCGAAQEIGYVETFSLADDREAALKELVPGTDDYFYYHALQAQNMGERQRFQETMGRWMLARHGDVIDRARELLNRQALLDYDKEPQKTLDYLKHELDLNFAYARKTGKRLSSAPSVFDNAAIRPEALRRLALRNPQTLGELSDEGLAFVATASLTDAQRRHLLSRLTRPDYPNLVELIVADLKYRDSRGFGHHPIHAQLTLAQLDDLLKRLPGLRNETAFVNAYLSKLAPENEVDLDTDASAREAYFERVWAFVNTLEPRHNSLKANVLYNRLRHDMRKGVYDRERFMAYIRLPRNVHYLPTEYRERVPHGNQFAQLGQNFNLIAMPPVPPEEPLVRSCLLAFFKNDADIGAFAPYVRDDFLKPLFAEAKIVNGIGDPQQWASLLSPEMYKRLKERVDIDFAADNPDVIDAEKTVKLAAFVKNVPTLIVNVYEINTFNYYCETGQPLNLAINLDGLMASVSRRLESKETSERRVLRIFDFPEIKDRGVYVVELIGNGKSSRALVQKGRLDGLQDITAAGHVFTVFDEKGKRVADASGWLAGREFKADKDGRILVPFSTAPKNERIVIRQDGFATLVNFSHRTENYSMKAGFYVDREALIRREKAQIIVRPVLNVSGRPTSLKLLEDIRLTVRSTDLQGIVTEKDFPIAALREDAEKVQEILVPEKASELTVVLRAKAQNLSLNQKQDLSDAATFPLNHIDQTFQIQALHVGQTASGYYAELRGKNGEPLVDEPLDAYFSHRYFRTEKIHAELKTDEKGRVMLGALAGIRSVRLTSAAGVNRDWSPQRNACNYPSSLQGKTGDALRLPCVFEAADASEVASLLEIRHGQFVADRRDCLTIKDGFFELKGLPAGDYALYLKAEAHSVDVRVTQGEMTDGFVVSSRRALESPRLAPLNVTAVAAHGETVEIRLSNVTPFTRVHLFATRYLPAYELFTRLGAVGMPSLLHQSRQPACTFYESGRDIGDEYRYIIDRQQAMKYPGNMLERPGLLLNPWSLRATESQDERLAEGGGYAGKAAGIAKAEESKLHARFRSETLPENDAPLDFLLQPAVTLLNMVPDKDGRVVVPRMALKGLPCLRVLAVDPTASIMKCAALEDSPIERRELRLVSGLDPQKAYAEQKRITTVPAKESVKLGDVTTARFESYDTVAKVYRLFSTLNADSAFADFSFVSNWPDLDTKEQRRLYSKYACHELSFFLYHKDRPFFDAVIAPYLKNKKDKTFLDRWLMGDDVKGYLEPWRFARLNAVERVLLGKRLREQEASVMRDTRERADLLLPDMETFNRRFDTAVQIGSLEMRDGDVALGVDKLREDRETEGKKDLRMMEQTAAAPAEAPSAVRLGLSEVSSAMRKNSLNSARQRGVSAADEKAKDSMAVAAKGLLSDVQAAASPVVQLEPERVFFDARRKDRETARRFFRQPEKTREWAENNYWHLPIGQQLDQLVKVNAFWSDYAAHDGKTPFLSKAFPEATSNFTEMMLALAVLDVPFKAAAHEEKLDGVSYTLQAESPLVLFHREIGEAVCAEVPGGVLVAQHFFRADDRERFENNERFDKLVTDEFLPQVVYGAQIVLTNPTGNRQKLHELLQIPAGAVPVKTAFYTRGSYVVLEPYTTQKQEYFFYFPSTGTFPHYPVSLASNDRVVGRAKPTIFNVVSKLSKVDTASWAWISQNGSEDDVIAFLKSANIHRLDLEEIAWRMKDRSFFKMVTSLLEKRHVYHDVLWSYGLLHNDPATIREYLRHSPFADRCGLCLNSTLLTLNPVERFVYQHLEYSPLVNPRAHPIGVNRTLLNTPFREQYQRFMKVLGYKTKPDDEDALATACYLALQDRVGEALTWFGRVDRKAIQEHLQYDYFDAYLSLCKGDVETARKLAKRHEHEGVDRWRERFTQVLAQLDEAAGGAGASGKDNRDRSQGDLAVTEPVLEMQVEAGRIRLDTRNIASCMLNFYPMDIELLFSRSPFLQEGAAQFSYIRPLLSRTVAVPVGQAGVTVELPPEFMTRNVMVEALACGVRKTQAYYANTLNVQMIENYGQLAVTHAETRKPVSGAYVKVYAKMPNGKIKFFKDGYTDLRGRFDYASLNTDELENTERLSVLVLSDAFGAVVREAPPPKR